MSRWKLAGWIGAAGAAAFAGAAAAVWQFTAKSQTPMRRPMIGIPNVPYEDIAFTSGGAAIKGWFIPPPSEPIEDRLERPPLIIVVHGWGSNKSRVLRYTNRLHEEGYALLLYDARSHGDSDEYPTPTGLMFRDDVLAAIAYALSRDDIDPERIGLLGHSLGGYGSLLAVGKHAPVRAVVTDSMPVQLDTVVRAELKRRHIPVFPLSTVIPRVMYLRSGITRKNEHELDVITAAKSTETPVLLIHSLGDIYIPPSELDFLLAGAKRPGLSHLFVESDGHSSSEADARFWEEVLPFFRSHVMECNVPEDETKAAAYTSEARTGLSDQGAERDTPVVTEEALPVPLMPSES